MGGVPTALFSGQLNFISVPLVLGVGIPFSPAPWLSIQPSAHYIRRPSADPALADAFVLGLRFEASHSFAGL